MKSPVGKVISLSFPTFCVHSFGSRGFSLLLSFYHSYGCFFVCLFICLFFIWIPWLFSSSFLFHSLFLLFVCLFFLSYLLAFFLLSFGSSFGGYLDVSRQCNGIWGDKLSDFFLFLLLSFYIVYRCSRCLFVNVRSQRFILYINIHSVFDGKDINVT